MEKEVMTEILGVMFNGDAILCETPEQRNEIARACWNSGVQLSMLTKGLMTNYYGFLPRPSNEYLCLVIVDRHLCSYCKKDVPDYVNDLVSIASFFTSPHSDFTDFDSRFALLLGQETG